MERGVQHVRVQRVLASHRTLSVLLQALHRPTRRRWLLARVYHCWNITSSGAGHLEVPPDFLRRLSVLKIPKE